LITAKQQSVKLTRQPAYTTRKFKKRIFFLPFALFVSFFSCNSGNVPDDHKLQLAQIADNATALADKRGAAAAIGYFNHGYARIENPGVYAQWKRLNFIGAMYVKFGQINNDSQYLKLGLTYADSMISTLRPNHPEKRYLKEYGSSFFVKGDALFGLNRYDEAFRCYYIGKQLVAGISTPCCRVYFNNRLALIDYRQHKFQEAAGLFQSSYRDELSCKTDFDAFCITQGAMDNAGLSYEQLHKYDSARTCFMTTLGFIERNEQKFPTQNRFIQDARGVTYGYLGMISQDAGRNNEAEGWFKKSIALNSYGGNERKNTQLIQLKLARIYLDEKRNSAADSLIKTIRLSLDTLPNQAGELGWQQLKWNYLFDINQAKNSTPYLLRYIRLKDSFNFAEKQIAIADAGNSFRQLKEDDQLTLLKKEDELHFLYTVLISIFSGLCIIIAFLVWRSWRRAKNNNLILRSLNKRVQERNERLQKAMTALEESQEENTKMMQIVAHDLRNPIGGITSVASMMLDEPGRNDEDRMFLELIKTSGQNSLELVSDLLQVHSRVEELKKEPLELSEMLSYCAELLRFKADAKSQRIDLDLTPTIIAANREKLWRVISNLVANAIKFSPSGATILVKLEQRPESALISVKDDGIGIPDEMKDKIFDMFTKAKRPGTAGEQPFGLGLAISRQIIEAHGGKIWFESKAGQGTTFFVELPV